MGVIRGLMELVTQAEVISLLSKGEREDSKQD